MEDFTMNKPVIEIKGQRYEIKHVKACDWRDFFKFDSEKKDILTYDFLDKHCEVIAGFFDGVSTEDLLENLEIEDILKIYNDILVYLMNLITSKLKINEKNAGTGESLK